MTEVAFHFNAPDRVAYACRLLRKANAAGARVTVTGEPELMRELDSALWTFSALEFIPHCHAATAPEPVLAKSPVVLTDSLDATPHHEVLVNLGVAVPPGFERFERLIEVVSLEPEDRELARGRWRHYADRGYAIARHDLGGAQGR